MRDARYLMLMAAVSAMVACAPTPKPLSAPVSSAPPAQPVLPLPAGTTGYQLADFALPRRAVQGGLLLGRAPTGTIEVQLDRQQVLMAADGYFLIGFDRDAPIMARLTAKLADGRVNETVLGVAEGAWQIEHVRANPTGSAASSAEFQARRGAELAQIAAARAVKSTSEGWRQQFVRPLAGRVSGLFGAQRVYNGTPGSYHSGMDIAAPTGTIFAAPADGVVTLAAVDQEFTLEGHLLIIDHGVGLNSAFLHASELFVKAGDIVRQGQPIGRVGATGRASGPHLHWGMKWNTARIDPMLLLPAS